MNSTAMASDVNVVSYMMVTITALAVIGGVLVYNRRKRIYKYLRLMFDKGLCEFIRTVYKNL